MEYQVSNNKYQTLSDSIVQLQEISTDSLAIYRAAVFNKSLIKKV